VWNRSVSFTKTICEITKKFPREEKFSLVDQLKRASVSVSSNIAEGSARDTKKDFAHFLNISRGSLFETISQLYVAKELGCIFDNDLSALQKESVEISRMLSGLRKSLFLK
jgi:four helix bundle protein